MLCLLWHICLSVDQGWVRIEAVRCYVSPSLYTCALRTGRCHSRATQSMCVITWLQPFISDGAAFPEECLQDLSKHLLTGCSLNALCPIYDKKKNSPLCVSLSPYLYFLTTLQVFLIKRRN